MKNNNDTRCRIRQVIVVQHGTSAKKDNNRFETRAFDMEAMQCRNVLAIFNNEKRYLLLQANPVYVVQ